MDGQNDHQDDDHKSDNDFPQYSTEAVAELSLGQDEHFVIFCTGWLEATSELFFIMNQLRNRAVIDY